MKIDGAKLKRLRELRLWTLRELSRQSGVDYTAISQMERGLREPHPRTIKKLAAALEIAPHALVKAVERE